MIVELIHTIWDFADVRINVIQATIVSSRKHRSMKIIQNRLIKKNFRGIQDEIKFCLVIDNTDTAVNQTKPRPKSRVILRNRDTFELFRFEAIQPGSLLVVIDSTP